MSHNADILSAILSAGISSRGEAACWTNWRLARSGATRNMSHRVRAFAVPIPFITAEQAVRVTQSTQSGNTGSGVPCPSSGSACAPARTPTLRSGRIVAAARKNPMRRDPFPKASEKSLNAAARQTGDAAPKPTYASDVARRPLAARASWGAGRRATKHVISTPVTAISASVAATVHPAIAGVVPAAARPREEAR